MLNTIHRAAGWGSLLLALALAPASNARTYTPAKWMKFVTAAGQTEPIPEEWLRSEEARIAHSLQLPGVVPKPVTYSFDSGLSGEGPGLFASHRQRAIAYFNHLCKTEAGEWIIKAVPDVEGFYFARPRGHDAATSDLMANPYGPENPWMERVFLLKGESIGRQGGWFVEPPVHNYLFVEQPRREVEWQANIKEPYIRLFGYTTEPALDPAGKPTRFLKQKTPMQVTGVAVLKARYGYTWRGIKRTQDREHGIAGGELLIYDLQSKEVIAVRRQFLISLGNPRTGDKAAWEVAAPCPQLPFEVGGIEFTYFVLDVLKTTVQSKTRRKP